MESRSQDNFWCPKRSDLRELACRYSSDARAQLYQDVFALGSLGWERGGFFVEFGASDGCHLSNTYLMEKCFGWKGILAEPARGWHGALSRNRLCTVDRRCVWSSSGVLLPFCEPADADLATLEDFVASDGFEPIRRSSTSSHYDVETVSLVDLLGQHGAPVSIDYLSVDTEGSEYAILEHFDFVKYCFKVITCEHNNRCPERDLIRYLLASRGYVRVCEDVSDFDDWYVHSSLGRRA